MRILTTLALAAVSTSALAVPMEFSHQGRMMDSLGLPLDGPHDLVFTLYDDPAAGTNLWSETHTGVDFDSGYYVVPLGSNTGLDDSVFDDDNLYLGITVDAGAELPERIALRSVPFAIRAGRAATADSALSVAGGGTVDAGEVQVGGTTVIDSDGNIDWTHITGAPASLGELICSSGNIPVFDGVDWQCGLANDHEHSAAQLTTGTLSIDRLPIGSGASEVAAGDHGHTAVDVGALPAGTTAGDIGGLMAGSTTAADVGALADTATAADVGALPDTATAADVGALPDTATASDVGALPDTATAADVGALPDTATASDVGALPDTATAVDVGAVPDTGGTINGDLTVTGDTEVQGDLTLNNQDVMKMLRLANARAICYGGVGKAQSGASSFSVIVIPYDPSGGSLEAQCTGGINTGWHSCGLAKSNYFNGQNCQSITNESYGGGYTSFVRDSSAQTYLDNGSYSNCDSDNAFICCSAQCTTGW